MEVEAGVAEAFGLGTVSEPLVPAAVGWGGHNTVCRLVTSTGIWAVKRHGWQPPPDAAAAFAIELEAHAGGVPMARPVPAVDGGCWARIGGQLYRCHAWVDGHAKQNEETSPTEAWAMGRLVAELHGLRIPAPPARSGPRVSAERWHALLAAGEVRSAPWAERLAHEIDVVSRFGAQPGPADRPDADVIGSHGDLNAHNVLFTDAGLCLIDWDGAGRVWPRWERANYPLLWAQRGRGRYDRDAVIAFLRGYVAGGGTVDADDPDALSCAPAALAPWVAQNLQMAVDRPSAEQDLLAGLLVQALVAMPRTVALRQALLAECLGVL